jgi:hypothetical protein
MKDNIDRELEDALGDPELIRIARLLSAARSPEPPLDDAFRSGLRRQLMDQAWDKAEGRNAWWRRLFAPQGMAWAGAAAVVVLVASVVLYTATQPPGSLTQEVRISTPLDDQATVAPRQPILVSFNQPMDHPSTEAAVQITPSTAVTYAWSGDTEMYIAPKSGNLAPNTQYQVTIGPGAKTLHGNKLTAPQTVTFVTSSEPNAAPSPTPSPKPSPSNTSLLTGVTQVASDYPPAGTVYPVLWSSDSSTIYFVGAGGALESVPAKGGVVNKLVADGVSLTALAPAGSRLAYVRGGKIEILDLTDGSTTEVAVDAPPTAMGWANGRLYWGTANAVFRLEAGAPAQLTDVSDLSGSVVSIAPDGRNAIVQTGDGLVIVNLASAKRSPLCGGGCATTLEGWSPDGSRVVYNGTIADTNGKTVSSNPPADPADMSWSTQNEILLGSNTALFEVRPDGTEYMTLANGTFHHVVWAPDGSTFAYTNGASLFVATAPASKPQPKAVDQALRVVNQFMQARLDGKVERAGSFLDDAGKAAYGNSSPSLIPAGDPSFKRFYILTSEVDPTNNSVRVVVRLVFAHGKAEQYSIEETLTLVRAEATDPYLIDSAAAGPQLEFGKGPQVVTVKVTATEVDVTFDSDLIATSIGNVTLQDAQGVQVAGTVNYLDRTVTFTGLQLTPGAHYRLVVLPGVEDVGNHNAAAEYDLDLVGPAPDTTAGGVTPPPGPSPEPSPSASPS